MTSEDFNKKDFRDWIQQMVKETLQKEKDKEIEFSSVIIYVFIVSIVSTIQKMEIFKTYIKFLGLEIGNGIIKLQDHITKKILDFSIEELKETKKLQSFLGLLNYARGFIKDLGRIAGPLYAKTSQKGQKSFNDTILLGKETQSQNNTQIKTLIYFITWRGYMLLQQEGRLLL